MYHIFEPTTKTELDEYFHFRWSILNAPLQLPMGSEKDGYDPHALHRMIRDRDGKPLAVGRVYVTDSDEAQIRYMAVEPSYRGKGIGALLLKALEQAARDEGAKRIVLLSRIKAISFFEKFGYVAAQREPHRMEGTQLLQMIKQLAPAKSLLRVPELCLALERVWAEQIPISEKMGITVYQYTGERFETRASLHANVNTKHAMFAGSIYSQATLTAWGLCWLKMKEQGFDGEIVVAKAEIAYRQPVTELPRAVILKDHIDGSFAGLKKGCKVKVKMTVSIISGEQNAADFEGLFIILPRESQSEPPPLTDIYSVANE
ncbi:bifunctional GNAT family N-acetyltransferase/hotdog fold thioesterase [Motilimonas sp. E26]|uniref:bifunctional GNAT family N-acetyltransferase/hotdog fold thioesterase n=1 Tax=Motilimonas sp. E26 TaxID=2865674 RepID=UPI001E49DCBD|nr:bifunctional GNAT family N-acetyltransferase/hotdog fold thioesterase [Motilimonas sp. E26]MCE0557286.1 bifunctional GNAT family N-acetyltransferase/hotdog fold thioesterase [Motilimonas sp. E26]